MGAVVGLAAAAVLVYVGTKALPILFPPKEHSVVGKIHDRLSQQEFARIDEFKEEYSKLPADTREKLEKEIKAHWDKHAGVVLDKTDVLLKDKNPCAKDDLDDLQKEYEAVVALAPMGDFFEGRKQEQRAKYVENVAGINLPVRPIAAPAVIARVNQRLADNNFRDMTEFKDELEKLPPMDQENLKFRIKSIWEEHAQHVLNKNDGLLKAKNERVRDELLKLEDEFKSVTALVMLDDTFSRRKQEQWDTYKSNRIVPAKEYPVVGQIQRSLVAKDFLGMNACKSSMPSFPQKNRKNCKKPSKRIGKSM